MGRYVDVNELGSTLSWREGMSGNNDERLLGLVPTAESRIDNLCRRRFDLDGQSSQRWFEITYASLEDGVEIDDAPHDHITEVVVRGAHPDNPAGSNHTFERSEWQAEPLARIRNGQEWPADSIKLVRQRLDVLSWNYDGDISFSPRSYGEYPYTSFPGQGNTPLGYLGVTARWGWPQVPAPIKEATLLMVNRMASRIDSPLGLTGNMEYGVSHIRSVDPDIRQLIASYTKPKVF